MRIQLKSWAATQAALLLGALLSAFTVNAQTDVSIGVVDLTRLMDQAPQAQAATVELSAEFAPRQREIAALQQSLQTKSETYQRDVAVLGETERLRLEREIQADQRDFQRRQTQYNEDVNIRQNEELANLQRLLVEQIQSYARGAGYDLVLQNTIFFSGEIDITEEVLRSLEASFSASAGGP
jgi:outer membrane protein